MENLSNEAAAAAALNPESRRLFGEVFASSPIANSSESGVGNYRSENGQFAARPSDLRSIPDTEPRFTGSAAEGALGQMDEDLAALEAKCDSILPDEAEPSAAFVRVKKNGGSSARYAARVRYQSRGGAIEDAAATIPVKGTAACLPYEDKFSDVNMLLNEIIKKDSGFKAAAEQFQTDFNVGHGPKLVALVAGLSE